MGSLSSAGEIPKEQRRKSRERGRYSPESDMPGGRYHQCPIFSREGDWARQVFEEASERALIIWAVHTNEPVALLALGITTALSLAVQILPHMLKPQIRINTLVQNLRSEFELNIFGVAKNLRLTPAVCWSAIRFLGLGIRVRSAAASS
ncbi:hypothetical protein U1Q18_003499 [Sarracenia purpurea var. burkii]